MLELVKRYDNALFGWFDHPKPTHESIEKIQGKLNFKIPEELIYFANHSKKFSSTFLSLGDDYEDLNNIIAKNKFIRHRISLKKRWGKVQNDLPIGFVIFTENFMSDDYWAFDTNTKNNNNYTVQYWSPLPRNWSIDEPEIYLSFIDFIESRIKMYESMQHK